MRVVPVIDLKAGTAVHAVRGERERYRPVGSEPLALARAFRSELGLDELYVADLDAIAGGGENDVLIRALAREARVMVDAGVSEPEHARALLDLGVDRVVVGTETLADADALDRLLPEAVLSIDLRDGRTLSPDPQLAGLPALDAVARLQRTELHEVIVLDLARVGSGAGPDVASIAASTPRSETSSCWPEAAYETPAICARSATRGRPARSSRRRCIPASSGRASSADDRLRVRDERSCHVGAGRVLQSVPTGDAVELEHVVAQQVDARVVGAQRLGRRHAHALLLDAQLGRLRAGAAREVRAPSRADPLDGREHPAADDEHPQVAVGRERLLEVVDRALEL
jgi:phosphoribosylformimino-5-aminoimidazole carboxamide ribotide isomerase